MDVEFVGKRVGNGEWVRGSSIIVTYGEDGDWWVFMPQKDEPCEITLDKENGVVTGINAKFYVVNPETVQVDVKKKNTFQILF